MLTITYVDARPLIHHVRAHAEQHTLKVPRLSGIAEDLAPRNFAILVLDSKGLQDLIQLTFDLEIIVRLLQEASDDMLCLLGVTVFGQPPRSFADERAAAEDCQRENHLASDWKAPLLCQRVAQDLHLERRPTLHGTLSIERGEAEPRSSGDPNDD